jgi:hypothetical protein
VWRSIRIAFHCDRRQVSNKTFGKPLFQIVILSLAIGHT